MFGLHHLPVRSADAAPVTSNALSRSIAWVRTASAMAVLFTSAMASTASRSNHWRATPAPTSGFCWWSAARISTRKPFASGWKSSTACFAASTEVGPELSRYWPERSVSTPILSAGNAPWARGPFGGNAAPTSTL